MFVNAGISEYKDQFFADDLDVDGELKEPDRRTIEVDTNAANDTVKLAIWHLRNRTDRKKGGSIVLTASLAGYLGMTEPVLFSTLWDGYTVGRRAENANILMIASAGAPLYSAAKHGKSLFNLIPCSKPNIKLTIPTGIVGLMRALKNDLAKLHISISLVAPGITTTPILLGSVSSESPEDTAKRFRSLGVPINQPEEIATAVAWLMSLGMEANGKGLLIQAGTAADVEAGLAKTRKMWMGTEILELFKGGRSAPLFPNKL